MPVDVKSLLLFKGLLSCPLALMVGEVSVHTTLGYLRVLDTCTGGFLGDIKSLPRPTALEGVWCLWSGGRAFQKEGSVRGRVVLGSLI